MSKTRLKFLRRQVVGSRRKVFASLTVVAVIQCFTAAASPQESDNSEPAAVKAMLQSNVAKAEQITFAQANLRINFENDTELEDALLHARSAKNSADVQKAFQSAKDNINDVLTQSSMVSLFKSGATLFGAEGASTLTDGSDWIATHTQQGGGNLKFSDIPPVYASAIILGGIQTASPEVKEAIARETATHLGKNFDDTVDAVTQNRILENPDNDDTGTQYVDRELYQEQTEKITAGLQDINDILKKQIAGQQADAQKKSSASEVATDTAHYKAGVQLAGLVLGPIVGPEATRKITTIGDNLIQMNTAVKQFGPSGLTPDNLLMFTNFATAGVAIVGMIAASQKPDPTMVALQAIMAQLQDIKKELITIEGKIDDLSNLVEVGFERTLTQLTQVENELMTFQRAVLGHYTDSAQRKAVKAYLNYVSNDPQNYSVAQKCDEEIQLADDQTCLNLFASLIADYTVFTGNSPRTPDLSSPPWTNQILTPKAISSDRDYALVLEQLSYPLFLANDPLAFPSMIAFNESAAAASSTAIMQTPSIANLVNPEVLTTALQDLVRSLQLRPGMRGVNGRPVIEQAMKRVDDTRAMLTNTVGSAQAMQNLWGLMAGDIKSYQDNVNNVLVSLLNSPYSDEKSAFEGGKKGTLPACPSMGAAWPALQVPFDPGTKQTMEKFVDPVFWVAEEMHLGVVAQCYIIDHKPAVRDPANGGSAYQIIGKVRIFFNRLPPIDPTKISDWETSTAASTYSSSSLPIATLSYTTNRHYSTYYGSTVSVFSHAWGSAPLNIHDVVECENTGSRISPFSIYDPNCKAGPDGDSPAQALVTKSTNEDAASGSQTKATTEELVHNGLTAVATNRSQVWDTETLSFVAGPDPKILQSTDVMDSTALTDILKQYTVKYLLAENLMLVSMYHQNPVASCLQVLNSYSPVMIIQNSAARMMQQDGKLADEFTAAMTNVNGECLGHSVNPSLADLENQLRQYH